MGAACESLRPLAKRRVALSHVGQSRARSMDQLPAHVFVAALADPEQLRLAAGRELTGNQAEPRGEIAPALESSQPVERSARRILSLAQLKVSLRATATRRTALARC
jgi:hypothetical protein